MNFVIAGHLELAFVFGDFFFPATAVDLEVKEVSFTSLAKPLLSFLFPFVWVCHFGNGFSSFQSCILVSWQIWRTKTRIKARYEVRKRNSSYSGGIESGCDASRLEKMGL